MGLYYKLSNGEDIEIMFYEEEDYSQMAEVLLFGGSTSISMELRHNIYLNDIIADIEKNYNDFKIADTMQQIRAFTE